MWNFDGNLVTDLSRTDDLKEWFRTREGVDILWNHGEELMNMAILAENITAIDIIEDVLYRCDNSISYERILVTAAKTSMETLLHILRKYCITDRNWKLRRNTSYQTFLEISQGNKDPRVRRFTERLGEFVDENGDIPTLRPEWLQRIEERIRVEVTEEGYSLFEIDVEIASRMRKYENILSEWDDFLKHACLPILPVKSARK